MRVAVLVVALLGVVGVGVGLGWWVHPGLGLAVSSALLLVGALTFDDGRGAHSEAP